MSVYKGSKFYNRVWSQNNYISFHSANDEIKSLVPEHFIYVNFK